MIEVEDDKSVIDRMKKFGKRSSDKYKTIIERIKYERAFACGVQWDDRDNNNRGADRARFVFNIVDNQINSAVNPFNAHPYKISYESLVQTPGDLIEKLNLYAQNISKTDSTKTAAELALKSMATAGYGYFYVTTDLDANKKAIVAIYPIEDTTLVIPDPDSTALDGSDSRAMAIIEHMSKNKAKALYGNDVIEDGYSGGNNCLVKDFGDAWNSPEDCIALVTYYEMTDSRNACVITKMIGNKIISSVTLNITHIPIVTFKGSISYDSKGDTEYVGLVHKVIDSQRIINYAESQLVERLSNAPVPVMTIPSEGIDGNIDQYKNINKRLNPVIVTKQYTKDGKEIREPKRVDNTFPTSDIGAILGQQKAIMTEVSGMPLTGLIDAQEQETATSILLRSKSVANNISHFTSHAKTSMKFLGILLLEFYKILNTDPALDTSLVVTNVTEGPEDIFNADEAKSKLIAIANFLPPEAKSVIAYNLCQLDINPDVKKVGEMIKQLLPPQALSDNGQAMMLQQQIQMMQEKFKEAMLAKDKQINDLNQQVLSLQLRSNSDVAIQRMKSTTELAKAEMDIQADSQKQQLDIAAKANLENAKLAAQAQRDREKLIADAMKLQSSENNFYNQFM
jgi:hypothetical protein